MQGLAEVLRHRVGKLGHEIEGIDTGRLYA